MKAQFSTDFMFTGSSTFWNEKFFKGSLLWIYNYDFTTLVIILWGCWPLRSGTWPDCSALSLLFRTTATAGRHQCDGQSAPGVGGDSGRPHGWRGWGAVPRLDRDHEPQRWPLHGPLQALPALWEGYHHGSGGGPAAGGEKYQDRHKLAR